MTKHDKKEISKLVKHLPEMKSKTLTERVTISGETLIALGTLKTQDGKMILPRESYQIERAKITNHKTSAERIFKQDGIEGVKKYCEQIREKYRLFHEQQENSAPNIN